MCVNQNIKERTIMMTNRIYDKTYHIKKESGYEVTVQLIGYDYDCVELRISKYLGSDTSKPILDVTSGVMLTRKDFTTLFGDFSNDLKELIDGTKIER